MNNLRKAQTLYVTRQQEYEKAKELSLKTESDILSHSTSSGNLTAKIDKKKKAEDDASHKVGYKLIFKLASYITKFDPFGKWI